MGMVYYAEYLHLFERGRSHHMRELGLSYAEVEARGLFLPVREADARYRRPARYDDQIHIRTAVAGTSRATVTFVYQVLAADRTTLLAHGSTQLACTDRDGRPTPLPDWLLKALKLAGR